MNYIHWLPVQSSDLEKERFVPDSSIINAVPIINKEVVFGTAYD